MAEKSMGKFDFSALGRRQVQGCQMVYFQANTPVLVQL
jgi:hypothetical protein